MDDGLDDDQLLKKGCSKACLAVILCFYINPILPDSESAASPLD